MSGEELGDASELSNASQIFGEDICRSLLDNQASYLRFTGRVEICINYLSGYSGWLHMFKPTAISVDLLLLGFVTKLTAYR